MNFIVRVAFAAFVLALCACGPGKPHKAENALTLAMGLEPPHLDPTSGAAAAIDEIVYANIFEGLTRIGANGEVRPALAKSWTASADGLVYEFHLQPQVRFHDGTTFDAPVVKFALERARAPTSTNAQKELFGPIDTIEVIDPLTVRIRLKRPVGAFLFNLAWGDAVMVAPATAAANAVHPVGTGPFRFSRWMKGARIELTRNADYWGTPARLDKISFVAVGDASSAYAALMAGDIDGFPDFPAPELLNQIKADPRFRVAIGTTEGETILAINNQMKPFDQLAVRRALSYAIDRKAVIDGAMNGYGTPIGSHFAPHNPAYVDLTARYPYDPAKARVLLAEAGFPNGFATTLKLPPPPYARRGGEIIAAQLRAIGISVRIENIEWAQWLDQVFARKHFALTIVAHTEPMDIGIYARDDYYFGYRSAPFKDLMQRLDNTIDETARGGLLQDAQRRLAEDAVNVFLLQLPKLGVWSARVHGQWINAPIQANDLTGIWIEP